MVLSEGGGGEDVGSLRGAVLSLGRTAADKYEKRKHVLWIRIDKRDK